MNGARRLCVSLAFLVLLLGLASCKALTPVETCVELVESGASPSDIRAAKDNGEQGAAALCEGLALIVEKNPSAAQGQLEASLTHAPAAERWAVHGFLARALAEQKRLAPALINWKIGIAGAAKAGNVAVQNRFRIDRAAFLMQAFRFDEAMDDYSAIYREPASAGWRLAGAYYALSVSIQKEDIALIKHWYPLTMDAARDVGDGLKMAYATEIYGQYLDDRHQFDESDRIYREAITAVTWTGNVQALADLKEFYGQSRFAAGDFERGREAYSASATIYGQQGHEDYARFMARNQVAYQQHHKLAAQIRLQRRESCEGTLGGGDKPAAIRAGEGVPPKERTFEGQLCLIQALHADGQQERAHAAFDDLAKATIAGGTECERLQELSAELGPRPQSARSRSAIDRNVAGACDKRT